MRIFFEVDNVLTEVLTVAAASYHYNFAPTTIRQWIFEDKIIAIKIADVLFIEKSSIESFLKRDSAT